MASLLLGLVGVTGSTDILIQLDPPAPTSPTFTGTQERPLIDTRRGTLLGNDETPVLTDLCSTPERLVHAATVMNGGVVSTAHSGPASMAQSAPLYVDGDTVSGKVTVRIKDGKRIEHQGVKIEFIGIIENLSEKSAAFEFTSLAKELAPAGELRHSQSYNFDFGRVEKPYESYYGTNVRLRYVVRVTISRRLAPSITKERDLWVFSYRVPPDVNNSIKMEVGIEDCLHIEFEYNKCKYHMQDVIVGKISFVLIRIKIKYMELSVIKRETSGAPPNQINDNETMMRFEIMDGAPGKGDVIPIRLFLASCPLVPTHRDICRKFSVRSYLNLVLVDEENRRYFKQQEITVYRRLPGSREEESLVPDLTVHHEPASPSREGWVLPAGQQNPLEVPSTVGMPSATLGRS